MRYNPTAVATHIFILACGFCVGRWSSPYDFPTLTNPLTSKDHTRHAEALNASQSKDRILFSFKVTVISFCDDEESCNNLRKLLDFYPGTKVLTASSGELKDSSRFTHLGKFGSRGKALNALIGKVETEYFLHLDSHHHVGSPDSYQGVGWLLAALEKVKSLDLIGGSLLVERAHKGVYDTLEVPCYRLHHYNYTYGETYEYRESILDMMVCERTSTSFLANTATFRSRGLSFDSHLKELLFEDFFLQAKTKGVAIATRMEVYFTVNAKHRHKRSAVQHVTTNFIADLMPFGLKHHVMTISDIDKQVLQICERFSTMGTMYANNALGKDLFKNEELLCDYDKARPYWKLKHWAYGGMFAPPTMMIALKRSQALAGNFFDAKGWAWTMIGGGALGAVKVRGFLPWEAGDIDISMNISKKICLATLRKEFVKQYPDFHITDHSSSEIIIKPNRGFGGWVTIFFGHWKPVTRTFRMNLDGYWVQISYYVFEEFKGWYTKYYLQHKMYNGKHLRCSEKSSTCLPDFGKLYKGRGGVWKEFFHEK